MNNVAPSMLGRPISHISYAVQSISKAVETWCAVFGAGPFFLLENIVFDRLDYGGIPAVWSHSAAFGQWGAVAVELQEMHDIRPSSTLGPKLCRGAAPNHVAYITPNLEDESARLEELGLPRFLSAQVGSVAMVFHDVPMLGHAIEIHRECDFIVDFFTAVARAADGWDGTDPLRATLPGS